MQCCRKRAQSVLLAALFAQLLLSSVHFHVYVHVVHIIVNTIVASCAQVWLAAMPALSHCRPLAFAIPSVCCERLSGPHARLFATSTGSSKAQLSDSFGALRHSVVERTRMALLLGRHQRCGKHSLVRRLPVPIVHRILDDCAPWQWQS